MRRFGTIRLRRSFPLRIPRVAFEVFEPFVFSSSCAELDGAGNARTRENQRLDATSGRTLLRDADPDRDRAGGNLA